jgi:hypothetical protein
MLTGQEKKGHFFFVRTAPVNMFYNVVTPLVRKKDARRSGKCGKILMFSHCGGVE